MTTDLLAGPKGGTSNDQLRRFNLSSIMRILHHTGGCSRAELTRTTGLNRSTIGALVAELAELGLAFEGAPELEVGRVGRPSLRVYPQRDIAAIAVNPDVDAISVGLVGLGGELIRRIRFDTTKTPSTAECVTIVRTIVDGMRAEIDASYRIAGVGIAIPGLVSSAEGKVLMAPHLRWKNQAITEPFSRALGYPSFAGNDASLAAAAENVFGVAKGMSDLVYLNGSSSGIGGGVIIAGTPMRGTDGYAGELGHTLVNSSGTRCSCGRIGCLETEVSLARLLATLGQKHIDPDELDIALGISRDPLVLAEVKRQIDFLSEAITNMVNLFNPEMVVLGGFLGSLLTVGRERLADTIKLSSLATLGHRVVLERARLRSKLLLIGAAEMAFAPILADPLAFAMDERGA